MHNFVVFARLSSLHKFEVVILLPFLPLGRCVTVGGRRSDVRVEFAAVDFVAEETVEVAKFGQDDLGI